VQVGDHTQKAKHPLQQLALANFDIQLLVDPAVDKDCLSPSLACQCIHISLSFDDFESLIAATCDTTCSSMSTPSPSGCKA
jgi:hypothetical protein